MDWLSAHDVQFDKQDRVLVEENTLHPAKLATQKFSPVAMRRAIHIW